MAIKRPFKVLGVVGLVGALTFGGALSAHATAQEKSYTIPSSQGTLTSNTWRSTTQTNSGNTAQWDYQVSATYSGSKTVQRIRSTWTGSASLRNGGSLSLGLSAGSVSVGGSSSWQGTQQTGYWENSNGAKSSSYRSNFVVTPRVDYRSGTIAIVNSALVKLNSSTQTYSINSGV